MPPSMPDLWSGVPSGRSPPHSSDEQPAAGAVPFVRCQPAQWEKVVSVLYRALHIVPPPVFPRQRISLTLVVAVIWRVKALQKQIPPKGPISFTPVCPLAWRPGLCDLCGSPLYRSAYGWSSRWRCDACILALHLALGYLDPAGWLAETMPESRGNAQENEVGVKDV